MTTVPVAGEAEIRAAIVETCRRMTALGLNHGTAGNASVRVGERLLITPSGVDYDRLTPEAIVSVAFDGSFEGTAQPSSEWRLHAALLRARPDVRAIVHTHSPHATAVACLREAIPAFHYLVGLGGRATIPCAEYATYGTAELAANAVAVLREGKTCLLANHGALALGATLRQALALAASIETMATQYVLARQTGTPVLLDDDEMARAIAKLSTYGPNRPEPGAAY
jgi:L-fuculose-phosphate aldolase